jgi:hypothetical protein
MTESFEQELKRLLAVKAEQEKELQKTKELIRIVQKAIKSYKSIMGDVVEADDTDTETDADTE